MTKIHEIFAKNLKLLRNQRGLSQMQLAQQVGISLNFLSMIEIARKFPSPEKIETFARVLNVKAHHLFLDLDDHSISEDPVIMTALSKSYIDSLQKEISDFSNRFFQR